MFETSIITCKLSDPHITEHVKELALADSFGVDMARLHLIDTTLRRAHDALACELEPSDALQADVPQVRPKYFRLGV